MTDQTHVRARLTSGTLDGAGDVRPKVDWGTTWSTPHGVELGD
ncbi:hypothetical protein ACWEIJ_05110 [Lentzea sp. NPDC004789]